MHVSILFRYIFQGAQISYGPRAPTDLMRPCSIFHIIFKYSRPPFLIICARNWICLYQNYVSLFSCIMYCNRAITKLLEWQRISSKKKIAAVVFTWVLAACIKFPLTWRSKMGISDEGYKIYLMIWTCLGWVIPLIVICVLYGICIKTLNSSSLKQDHGDAGKRRRKEDKRVVKMFVLIVVLFFVFTIPHSIIDLFRYIDNKSSAVILIHECSVILVLVNSCTNPFVYARMHRDVNAFVVKTWMKLKGMKSKSLDSTTEGASAESVI